MLKKSMMLAFITGVAIVGISLFAAQNDPSEDEQNVRQLISKFSEGWNKHDAQAMAETAAEDGDILNPFGKLAVGRKNIQKLFEEEQKGIMRKSSIEFHVQNVRFLTPKVASVDADVLITNMEKADGSKEKPTKHHIFLIAMPKDGQWQFVSLRAYALTGKEIKLIE